MIKAIALVSPIQPPTVPTSAFNISLLAAVVMSPAFNKARGVATVTASTPAGAGHVVIGVG